MSTLRQQKHDLLTTEILFLKPRLRTVKIRKHITLLKLPFERLDHFRPDLPILVTANTVRNLSLLNPNVRDDLHCSVILPQVAKRRPIVIILRAHRRGQYEK